MKQINTVIESTAGACGLKHWQGKINEYNDMSRPRGGVWIETQHNNRPPPKSKVTPPRGRVD